MSMYTKDIKEPGQKIYFLNDDNIAFDKNVISCAAGFNAVASQEEFTEVYSEFKNVSSDFYKLSSKVETSAATLDGKIDGVSAAVDTKFLPLSGGAVDHLSVSNGLKVSEGLTAYGLINTDQVKTNPTGDITISGAGVNRHGSIDIQFEGGMNSISVNGVSLSSYIRESINELDVDTVKAGEGKIFDEIKQRDGKISATIRDLVSADIPELPVSKISRLEDDYATKQYTLDRIGQIEIQYDEDGRRIWIVNQIAGLSSSIDANKFIKDGMIESVTHEAGGTGHPDSEGPYIVITWNTDAGKTQTWIKLREFASMYSSDDPGLKVGVGGDKFKLALDYDVVAKAADVSGIASYITGLSAPATGAIDVLSAGVDSALSSTALTVKFLGHIIIYADETPHRSFRQILEDAGLFDEHLRVKNGSMYQITYLNSSGDPVGSKSRYETTDGLVLGDGDYVYVHKHGLDAYVQADEIVVSGDGKTVYLANPVHRYDIAKLHQFVIDNFVKLSGNNEINGGNLFHGVNSFDSEISVTGNLSVGFDKLFDLRDGKSLNKLSCEISSEIKELSAALSGEIDTLSVKLSGQIDNLSAALSGEIDTLSAKLSGEISSLSVALSGEIDTLSAKLSGEISSLSGALSNEISVRAMISVDAAPTNEFKFKRISRDEYHDLVLSVDDKAVDPNTLYVISSDNMSMYGQKIIDLKDGELSGDACTYGQLSVFKTDLYGEIGALSGKLSAEISSRAMLSVDDKPVQEFRFQRISQEDYHDLVMGDGKPIYGVSCDPNTLYVVSSDDMSMYGQKITNLADGELSNDACTYGQLSAIKARIKSAIDEALPGTLEENLSASLKDVLKCLFDIKTALS